MDSAGELIVEQHLARITMSARRIAPLFLQDNVRQFGQSYAVSFVDRRHGERHREVPQPVVAILLLHAIGGDLGDTIIIWVPQHTIRYYVFHWCHYHFLVSILFICVWIL